MRVCKRQVIELGLLLTFKVMLEVSYIAFVHPVYGYAGFSLSPDLVKWVESYLLTMVLYCLLPTKENRLSSIALKLLFVILLVPILSLYALKDQSRFFLYLLMAGFAVTVCIVQVLPRLRIKRLPVSRRRVVFGLAVFSLLVYAVLLRLRGLPSLGTDILTNPYDVRADYMMRLPAALGYLVPWQANVVNSFLIGLFYCRRRYLFAGFLFVLQIMLAMMVGFKSFLFAPVLVVFVIHVVQSRRLLLFTLAGLISGICLSLLVYPLTGVPLIPSLLIRRLLFVPAQNHFHYYDFFSQHPLMHLSHSLLNWLFENPYSHRISTMIGELYYGNPATSVNVGYLADAYMNFGAMGVILFSILLGFFLLLLDSVGGADLALAAGVTVMPLLSLVNSALFTTLLTHGLLLVLVLLWSWRATRTERSLLCAG